MAFHENFWVATSTVAPVIALATVVALPDGTLIGRAQVVLDAVLKRPASPEDHVRDGLVRSAQDIRKRAWIAWLVTLGNLIIQAGLLAISLSALASRQDIVPLWVAICLATGGILLLALTGMLSVELRWELERGLFRKGGFVHAYLRGDVALDAYVGADEYANSYLAAVDSAGSEEPDPGPAGTHFPTAPGVGVADELAKLARLRDSGVITDDEFAKRKASLLSRI